MYEVPAEVTFDVEGCFTLPIHIKGEYIGEGLCDSRENANLMSVKKAKELGNLKMSPYPYSYTIGYANGHVEKAIAILRNFQINTGGFENCLDIVIADTRGRYDSR